MRNKLLAVLCLSTFLFLAGCGRDNTNANTNAVVVTTPTPVTRTNETANVDPTLKTRTEQALKAKNFNDVTVDTSTSPATLRGTVPKGKLTEAIQTAQEAAGKPFQNQLTEK